MVSRVVAFTDTYFPTINGATYMIESWKESWNRAYGEMHVVYPGSPGYTARAAEHPVRSVSFPFYPGYRVGVPSSPGNVPSPEVVHAHGPFSLGLAALRFARKHDVPLVASYHTPAGEYAGYISSLSPVESAVTYTADRYERWFYDRADVVLAPTAATKDRLLDRIGVSTDVEVLGNGIDLDHFRPRETAEFLARYDLPTDRRLVGYTGRHGYEKRLDEVFRAADRLDDVTLVVGGDGPANDDLRDLAADLDVDARFIGYMDEEEVPAFYSAVDVFAFPSTVETSGLVAQEACACGTPVVAADAGALRETVVRGETGYLYTPGDVDEFAARIEAALDARAELERRCLDHREETSVANSVAKLKDVYEHYGNGRR